MSAGMWWKKWGDLVTKWVMLAASFVSLTIALTGSFPAPNYRPWWTTLFLLLFVSCVALDFRSRPRIRFYKKGDTEGIRRYMHDWVQHGGRAAIWSHDMSWADNPATRAVLAEKARKGELILCLPAHNQLSRDLEGDGAEVHVYGSERFESPASRFTIIFFGTGGAQVAIGRAQNDTHVIEEFAAGGHPTFHLAEDLIALVRAHFNNPPRS